MVGALGKQIEHIYPISRNEETIRKGVRKGLFEKGYDVSILKEADILLLCMYPDGMLPFLKENRKFLRDGQLIMDVGGIKSELTASIQEWLQEEGLKSEFLGAHPMAGTHGKGIDKASEELFLGTRFIITPTAKNTREGVELGKALGETLGVRNIYVLTPEEHDRLVAYTSQLPHLMAVALVNEYQEGSEKLLGGSFRDATRVADINEDLWSELFLLNKEALIGCLSGYINNLEVLKEAIENDDEEKLKEEMNKARERKEAIS